MTRDEEVTDKFFSDGNYRLACRVKVLGRYRLQVTPPGGGKSIIVHRYTRTAYWPKRPGPRKAAA